MSAMSEIQALLRDVIKTERVIPSEIYVIDPILADLRREVGKAEPEPIVIQCALQPVKILPMSAYPAEGGTA